MANGPLGGFMPTPAAPAQPPQVKLDTTADSRGNFNNFLKSMNGATSLNPPVMAPAMGAMAPNMAPTDNIDIFNQPVQNFFLGGSAMSGGGFSDADLGSQMNEESTVDDDPVAGFDFDDGSFDIVSTPPVTGDEQQQNITESQQFVDTPSVPNVVFNNQAILNATKDLPEGNQTQIQFKKDIVNTLQDYAKDNDLAGALNQFQIEAADGDKRGENIVNSIIQASNVNPAAYSAAVFNQPSEILSLTDKNITDLAKTPDSLTDSGLRGSLTPGVSQDIIDTAKNAIRSNAGNNLAIDNLVAQFGSLDPSIGQLADRTKRGIGEIGQISRTDVEDLSGTPTITREFQGPIQARTIFDLDTTGTKEFRIPDSQSELDQAPSTSKLGFASSNIPGQFDETASGEAFAGGDIPLSVAPFTTTRRTTADDTDPREDTLGVLSPKTLADIERLSNVPVGQRKAGPGSDPTFFSGLGLPSIFDGIERFSRDRMASRLARGDVPEKNIVRNNSGLVIGIKDNFGNLVEGIDPNQQLGSDDGQDTIIRRPIAPIVEEKTEDDKPPNVIGGGAPRPVPEPVPTVVASPFAPASSAINPITFDSGDLNRLIEMLTGVAGKPVVSAEKGGLISMANGGLIKAVDDFLAAS